jgi:hypothetical protein
VTEETLRRARFKNLHEGVMGVLQMKIREVSFAKTCKIMLARLMIILA